MKDYFEELIESLRDDANYDILTCEIQQERCIDYSFLSEMKVNKEISEIYMKYKKVKVIWKHIPSGGYGEVDFVPLEEIEKEHDELVAIMQDLYQYIEDDREKVKTDIENWYPVFRFSNGDMFCIDSRNGQVVFYEHEVYDTGIDLHGLLIASDINDLFDKWSKCKFFDLYDWSKGVNKQGIDLSNPVFKQYMCRAYQNITENE